MFKCASSFNQSLHNWAFKTYNYYEDESDDEIFVRTLDSSNILSDDGCDMVYYQEKLCGDWIGTDPQNGRGFISTEQDCVCFCTDGTAAVDDCRAQNLHQCSSCNDGYALDTTSLRCEKVCGDDKVLSVDGAECVATCEDNEFVSLSGLQCVSDCGALYVSLDNACVASCPEGTFAPLDAGDKQCVAECPDDQFGYKSECVSACDADKFIKAGTFNVCVDACGAGEFAEVDTRHCKTAGDIGGGSSDVSSASSSELLQALSQKSTC